MTKFQKWQAIAVVCAFSTATSGCNLLYLKPEPVTPGEVASGYTYIPIDPTKVHIEPRDCSISYGDIGDDQKNKKKLLDMLPDNAVRLSMEISDTRGNVTYGVAKAGASGAAYKLTADYVNSDTVNKSIWVKKTMLVHDVETQMDSQGAIKKQEQTSRRPVPVTQDIYKSASLEKSRGAESRSIPGTEQYELRSSSSQLSVSDREILANDDFEEFNVPIYVGIGLRIVAEGVSLSAEANISGIGIVGAEAEAKRLLGSLTVQTLGVNSQAVASALPVHSELSRTTAENAFVAIGSIKALLHQPDTIKFPRVVGLYLPFPGGKSLVNALISELSRNPVNWCPNGYSNHDKMRGK
jgi:hypothetical protein